MVGEGDGLSEGFWRERPVLLTGAQGFIGSWLAEALLEQGARLTCVVRDEPARSRFDLEGLGERATLVRGDLGSVLELERVLNEAEIDTVFHLAAQTIVGTANRSPLSTFETNVRGTYNLLEACRRIASVRGAVVASSDKAYGPQQRLPYTEDAPLLANNPYEASKAAAEAIVRAYSHTYDLAVAVTRLANVYGGGDFNFSRIVPETVRALLEERAPVLRSDGSPQRDFLYVEDAVSAYLALGAAVDRDDVRGQAFNAGAGEAIPVIELVERLIEISGLAIEPDLQGDGTPHGEIERQVLDSTRIRERVGWSPRWSLGDGLRATFEWYARQLGRRPAVSA